MKYIYLFIFCVYIFSLKPCLSADLDKSSLDCKRALYTFEDFYNSFKELSSKEVFGKDYRIVMSNRQSFLVVLSPHGGFIEPFTSEIVKGIAGSKYSYYLFEGIKPTGNWKLHITSKNFDEPRALDLITRSQVALSIHGYKNEKNQIIEIGGMNFSFAEKISEAFSQNGFQVSFHSHRFPAYDLKNLVNKAPLRGVQLEIPSSLRGELIKNPNYFNLFITAIRKGIEDYSDLRSPYL